MQCPYAQAPPTLEGHKLNTLAFFLIEKRPAARACFLEVLDAGVQVGPKVDRLAAHQQHQPVEQSKGGGGRRVDRGALQAHGRHGSSMGSANSRTKCRALGQPQCVCVTRQA